MSTGSGNAGTSDMRVLSESECYELLAVATVGRIGIASSTGIQILPVNYRLGAGHRLFVMSSRHGTIGQLAEANAPPHSRSTITPMTSQSRGACS
jgi:nitroimidazol reductase NimA-like FMN-containing flavoprotein (pyridoxamine 5'-phosphate oxidase superfamily)